MRIQRPALFLSLMLVLLLLTGVKLAAQEMMGITGSKYSGIHSALINPSLPVLSPYYFDLNILTAHLSVENNYLYMAKDEYQFRRFLKSNPQYPTHPPDGKFYYDYYTPPDKKGYVAARLMGPSAAIMAGRHAYGIYWDVRSATSVKNIPLNLAKFFYEGLTYPPQYDIRYVHEESMSVANLEWAELALNYSYILQNRNLEVWSAGITLKRLMGYAGAYAQADHLDYMVPEHDTLIVYSATGIGGMSLPLDYQTDEFLMSPLFRGNGFGLDIGFTYEKKLRSSGNAEHFRKFCSQYYVPYHYRLGIALIDIGSIRFKQNALKFKVEDGSLFWPGISDVEYTTMNTVVSNVSNHFFGNPTELIIDDQFGIFLPMAVSIHGDYNFSGRWFASGHAVLPVRIQTTQVNRPALLAVSGRYETRHLSACATASLFDWTRMHLGVYGRFRGFFIGTEKISAFFHLSDFTGIDIYAGLKLSLQKGVCRKIHDASCGNNEYLKYQVKKKRSRR